MEIVVKEIELTPAAELQHLRDKLSEIEAEISANRLQIIDMYARQSQLAQQRSELWKVIARLTLAGTTK